MCFNLVCRLSMMKKFCGETTMCLLNNSACSKALLSAGVLLPLIVLVCVAGGRLLF